MKNVLALVVAIEDPVAMKPNLRCSLVFLWFLCFSGTDKTKQIQLLVLAVRIGT